MPESDQLWAIDAIIEHRYRRMFKLSKKQMLEEPIDEVFINLEIDRLVNKKAEMEEKRRQAMSKKTR